jgi:putative redox protein
MKHLIETTWKGNMKFEALLSGHSLLMDAMQDVGGMDSGPRPKELMLASIAGCTGMDVISILNKMRVETEYFNVKVDAELTDEHPKHYNKMHLIYQFKGKNLEFEKLKKAIDLSQDKYCGVSAVYKKTMELSYEIEIIQ